MVSPPATVDRGRLRELTAEGWFRLALLVLGLLVVAAALVVLALLAGDRSAVQQPGRLDPAGPGPGLPAAGRPGRPGDRGPRLRHHRRHPVPRAVHQRPGRRDQRCGADPRPDRRRAADGRRPGPAGTGGQRLAARLRAPADQPGPAWPAERPRPGPGHRQQAVLRPSAGAVRHAQNAHLAARRGGRFGQRGPGPHRAGLDLRRDPGRLPAGVGRAGGGAAARRGPAAAAAERGRPAGRGRRLQPPHRAGRPGRPVVAGDVGGRRCAARWSARWTPAGPPPR